MAAIYIEYTRPHQLAVMEFYATEGVRISGMYRNGNIVQRARSKLMNGWKIKKREREKLGR
jgi:hypothetical protein